MTKFATISAGVTKDVALEFKWVDSAISDLEYFAELPFAQGSSFDRRGYVIYAWKDYYAYRRGEISSLPGDEVFSGGADTVDDCITACVEDAKVLHRLWSWQQYMRNNYPPERA